MRKKPDRSNPGGRHGGDIQGMIDRLDYIADMGFTASLVESRSGKRYGLFFLPWLLHHRFHWMTRFGPMPVPGSWRILPGERHHHDHGYDHQPLRVQPLVDGRPAHRGLDQLRRVNFHRPTTRKLSSGIPTLPKPTIRTLSTVGSYVPCPTSTNATNSCPPISSRTASGG